MHGVEKCRNAARIQILGTILIWNVVPFSEPQAYCTHWSKLGCGEFGSRDQALPNRDLNALVGVCNGQNFGSASHLSGFPMRFAALACVSAF